MKVGSASLTLAALCTALSPIFAATPQETPPPTQGAWLYTEQTVETLAIFETPEFQALFGVRCSPEKELQLARLAPNPAEEGQTLRVTIGDVTRAYDTQIVPGQDAVHMAPLALDDPLIAGLASGKGRVLVEVEGEEPLNLPASKDVAKVIAACR